MTGQHTTGRNWGPGELLAAMDAVLSYWLQNLITVDWRHEEDFIEAHTHRKPAVLPLHLEPAGEMDAGLPLLSLEYRLEHAGDDVGEQEIFVRLRSGDKSLLWQHNFRQ